MEYDGAGQSVLSTTYYNLELGGTGTASAAGNVTCNGTFTLQSSMINMIYQHIHIKQLEQ